MGSSWKATSGRKPSKRGSRSHGGKRSAAAYTMHMQTLMSRTLRLSAALAVLASTTIAAVPNSRRYDVMWAVGSAEWPSGSSVIPSLFDSRMNLTASSSGQDYGRFASEPFNAKIDAAAIVVK